MSELTVPGIFGNGMVLQCEAPVPVWGKGPAGAEISVCLRAKMARARVADDGCWRLELEPLAASAEPAELRISAEPAAVNGSVTIQNVLVGEVWVCSGQSNMEWILRDTENAVVEIAGADYPEIRRFKVPHLSEFEEQDDCPGSWAVCSPETAASFTAVGYYFAKGIRRSKDIPVGLISSNWGGTPVESWSSLPALRAHADWADFEKRIAAVQETLADPENGDDVRESAAFAQAQEAWDVLADSEQAFARVGFDDSAWDTMLVPQLWEKVGLEVDGVVWFRTTIELPADWAGEDAVLNLGPVDDYDNTFWNGTRIGGVGPDTANSWQVPRQYTIAGELIKPGRNLLAVRVFNVMGAGGICGTPEGLALCRASGGAGLNLAGDWRYQVHLRRPLGEPLNMGWLPGGLYNAMIHPLISYGIRGVIWYQGESNADRALQYQTLFADMIRDWRSAWGQGDFPFYFVQLANFNEPQTEPGSGNFAELREAQTMALALPETGMAVIVDIGEAVDIHPQNKRDVGERLAVIARNQIYGEPELVYSGPLYESQQAVNGRLQLKFTHAGTGITTAEIHSEGKYTVREPGKIAPSGFALGKPDGSWVWAQARIVGLDTIELWHDEVPAPSDVRYGWHDNPVCNVYNREGLPAVPFRTR